MTTERKPALRKPCFKNRYHPSEKPCPRTGVWRGKPVGNLTDDWTWCSTHAPEDHIRGS